jgi:O-antigen/teichoic acid export membrane protein
MKKFFIETKELLLSQGIIALLAIIQVRVVATNLGPEIYGNIGVYLGFVGISFRILNSRNSDLILINSNLTDKNFTKSAVYLELILGVASLFFVSSIFFIYYKSIDNYLILYFFTRVLFNIQEVFKGVFTHTGDMKTYSLVESFSNVIRFILVVSFISFSPSISSFFFALSIHQIVVSILILIFLYKSNLNQSETMYLKEYMSLSKKSFYKIRTDQAVGLIPTHLDVVVIGYFANYYSAGIYRIAKKLVDPINSVIVAFSPWMLNKISKNNNYSFKKLTKNILIPSSILIIFLYFLFGNQLIQLIAGNAFYDSFSPMMILLVGFISYYLTFWTRHYLLLNDLILKHTIARVINLGAFVLTAPLLITNYGFNGIAISISLSVLLQKIYELSVYLKNKNLKNNI